MPISETTDHRSDASVASLVLSSRLLPPELAPQHVRRRGLVDALRAGASRRLTLVDAPAGFGKTTLLAEWCATDTTRRRFAWVSLDQTLDDPERFWTHVIAALTEAVPHMSRALPGGSRGIPDEIVRALGGALATSKEPVVLVLDDYHALSSRDIHGDIAHVVQHLPPGLQLVIITRSDPPLPLGRLRANGDLAEIRAEHLRFTIAEATALLNQRLALDVDHRDVARLVERTEGWVAGLSLAALSLREHPDRRRFVSEFAGTNRHVVDYLGSEVLALQTPELHDFLCRTAILTRLTGPACDALLARHGSIEVLRQLERKNAFVVALDADRTSYRYHQLLAELLRGELAGMDPAIVADLHRRASVWYRGHGDIAEAIEHAVSSNDIDSVPDLISSAFLELIETGHRRTVARWLAALPAGVIDADPRLCLAAAAVALEDGRIGDVDTWIVRSEAHPRPAGAEDLDAHAATLRCVVASDHVPDGVDEARAAIERLRDEPSLWGGMAAGALGAALYWAGHPGAARRWLQDAGRRGGPLTRARARAYESLLALDEGDRAAAEHLAGDALALIDGNDLRWYPRTSPARIAFARALAARGAVAAASAELETALELARRSASRCDLIHVLTALAQLRYRGRLEVDARTLWLEASARFERCPCPGPLARLVEEAEPRLAEGSTHGGAEEAAAQDLSNRELDVLRLLPSALTEPDIGGELFISHHTVHTHTRAIYRKLGVSSRTQAVHRARALGLLEDRRPG